MAQGLDRFFPRLPRGRVRPAREDQRDQHGQRDGTEDQTPGPSLPLRLIRYPLPLLLRNHPDQEDRQKEEPEKWHPRRPKHVLEDARDGQSEDSKGKKRRERHTVQSQGLPQPGEGGKRVHERGGTVQGGRERVVNRSAGPGWLWTFASRGQEIQPLSMNYSGYAYLVGYMLVYFGVVGGIWAWRLNRRQERPPVSEKLMRAPGESLRRKIEAFDDKLLFHLVGSALIPLLVMVTGLWIIGTLSPTVYPWALAILLLALAAVLFFSARWLIRILGQRRDHYLGYYGERVVGETLDHLRAKGFRVFHNVPAAEATPAFDIDHVVIGSTGIFAIETKTRRRQKSRPGFEDHKIIFDGQQLVYPWGEDFHGLNQARDHAVWLENWCVQVLGRRVPVTPILAFPGWWVEEHAVSTVRVANPNQIPALVLRGGLAMTEEQIELLTRQFEARGRDVEF